MSRSNQNQTYIAALPFKIVYLLYSILFGVILFESGMPSYVWLGASLLLVGIGLEFERIHDRDVPVAIGVSYLIGILACYALLQAQFAQRELMAIIPGTLFVAGIVGNLLYFLSEKQKLLFLNGQIPETALSLRRVERWFPLWLVVGGNILLILAVTPFFWSMLHQVSGEFLFVVKSTSPSGAAEAPFRYWFIYLVRNINESFMGVASLLGITFDQTKIMPTGFGKALVFLFRAGSISLVLGAVKRYLDLRATTRRLMVALGRSAMEEARGEATEKDQGALLSLEGRRQMWQVRLRQLLRLYPSELNRVLATLEARGRWRINFSTAASDKALGENYSLGMPPGDLSRWVRAELIEMLEDPNLYTEDVSVRYDVLRILLALMKQNEEDKPLAPEIRRKGALGLVHLSRPNDPAKLRLQIQECLADLAKLGLQNSEEADQDWERIAELRAYQAANYGLIALGDLRPLSNLLSALQHDAFVLPKDVNQYIEYLVENFSQEQAVILLTAQRLVLEEGVISLGPVLNEMKSALAELTEEDDSLRLMAANALSVAMVKRAVDKSSQTKISRVLLACGVENAVPKVWDILSQTSNKELTAVLLQIFVRAGQADPLIALFCKYLQEGNLEEQVLAANLLGALPAIPKNRLALREAIQNKSTHDDVRWMCLRALATLGHQGELSFLQGLGIIKAQPRLWTAMRYACYQCGDPDALIELVGLLAEKERGEPLFNTIREVFVHALSEVGEAACDALDTELNNDTRKEASETLVAARSALALLTLTHILQNPKSSRPLRQSVAEDLGLLGRLLHRDDIGVLGRDRSPAEWVSEPLLHALEHDKDRLVRIRAARALGRLGLPRIRAKFEEVLTDPKENALLRQVIAQAVGEMGDRAWEPFLLDLYEQEKSVQVRQGVILAMDRMGVEVPFFERSLGEKNAKLKQLSLQALAHRRLSEEQKLRGIDFLSDKHKDVRAAAAEFLGSQKVVESIPSLCGLINHEEEKEKNVRRAALRALRKVADTEERKEEIWPFVEKNFREDPEHLVIQDCAYTLVRIYDDKCANLLLESIEKRKKNPSWKKGFAGIVRAIGELGLREAGPILFAQLKREWKSHHLHLPRLISLIRPGGLAGGTMALPLLMELIDRNDPAFSWIATQVIAEIGDPEIVVQITELFETKKADGTLEPNLEAALLVALVRLGSWEHLRALIALTHALERPIARRRALGMISDLQLGLSELPLLMAMHPQHTPHEKLRETAVRSLGSLAGNLELSLQALRWQAGADPRAKIREAAESTLRGIVFKLNRALKRLNDTEDGPVETGQVSFHNQPIHPVFAQRFTSPPVEELEEFAIAAEAGDISGADDLEATEIAKEILIDEVKGEVEDEPSVDASAIEKKGVIVALRDMSLTVKVVESIPVAPTRTFRERLFGALLENDSAQTLSLLQQGGESFLEEKPWQVLQEMLVELEAFRKQWAKDWLIAPCNPYGSSEQWPFLIKREPILRSEFLDYCKSMGEMKPAHRPKNVPKALASEPVTGLSWIDVERFVGIKGWSLPTHEQLVHVSQGSVLDLQGDVCHLSLKSDYREWTASSNPRRRELSLIFSATLDRRQHERKNDHLHDVTFRPIRTLNSHSSLLEKSIAVQAYRHLLHFFDFLSHERNFELPEEVQELLSKQLEGPVPLIPEGLPSKKKQKRIQIEQEQQPESSEAKSLKVSTAASMRDAGSRKAVSQALKVTLSVDEQFWSFVEKGDWDSALAELDGKKLSASIQASAASLSGLLEWLKGNQNMVWVSGVWTGDRRERPFLVQELPVTRRDYFLYCQENRFPLPRGWSPSYERLEEPASPVAGVSFEDAKRYANRFGCDVPSFEQLTKANFHGFLESQLTEWTSSTTQGNRNAMKVFGSLGTSIRKRTHQRDERTAALGFRVIKVLEASDVPVLLKDNELHLPTSFEVGKMPKVFVAALRSKLNN